MYIRTYDDTNWQETRDERHTPGTSPTRRSDIVLNVHDMRDVPEKREDNATSLLTPNVRT